MNWKSRNQFYLFRITSNWFPTFATIILQQRRNCFASKLLCPLRKHLHSAWSFQLKMSIISASIIKWLLIVSAHQYTNAGLMYNTAGETETEHGKRRVLQKSDTRVARDYNLRKCSLANKGSTVWNDFCFINRWVFRSWLSQCSFVATLLIFRVLKYRANETETRSKILRAK